MNSKLIIWNDALLQYYFAQSPDNEAHLEISKDDLKTVFTYTSRYQNNPELFSDWTTEKYLDDFSKCFKIEAVVKGTNARKFYAVDKKDFKYFFKRAIQESSASKPCYLPYIALFIMPIMDDDITNGDRRLECYYDYLDSFCEKIGIKTHNEIDRHSADSRKWMDADPDRGYITPWSFNFSTYKDVMDSMWAHLRNWSSNEPGVSTWNLKSASINPRYIYISPFFGECRLSSTQKARLPRLFYESRTPVNSVLDKSFVKQAILGYGQSCLGFSQNSWRELSQDERFINQLVSLFYSAYPQWNGEGRSVVKKEVDGKQRDILSNIGTRINVRLYYREYDGISHISFRAFKKDFSEVLETMDGGKIRFTRSGWARDDFRASFNRFIESGEQEIEFLASDDYSATFRKSMVYILEKSSDGTWASTRKVRHGESHIILVSSDVPQDILDWLSSNDAKLVRKDGLPSGLKLYYIERVIKGSDLYSFLRLPVHIKILRTGGVELWHKEYDVTLSDFKNIRFEIEGIDPSSSCVSALTNTGSEIGLSFDSESHEWTLERSNYPDGDFSFTLKVNETTPDRHVYYITRTFIKNVELPRKNALGIPTSNGAYVGLLGSYSIQDLNLKQGIPIPDDCQDLYDRRNDAFLYDLSCAGHMTKASFIQIAQEHMEENAEELYYPSLIGELEKSGFIETTYDRVKGQEIYVIPPTLVMLPNRFQKIVDGITRIDPVDGYYTGLVLGARTEKLVSMIINKSKDLGISVDFAPSASTLLPCRIALYSKAWRDFSRLAKDTGLLFEGNSYYSASVLSTFPDPVTYFREVVLKTSPVYRYPTDNSFKGFTCLDYELLAEALSNRLKGIKAKKNIFKKRSFDPQLDLVSYETETILWYKNNQYVVDKYWGHLIVCALKGIKGIVQIDPEDPLTLCLPTEIKLPSLISRAITLVTGDLPNEKNEVRRYRTVDNPYMQDAHADHIISKLIPNR